MVNILHTSFFIIPGIRGSENDHALSGSRSRAHCSEHDRERDQGGHMGCTAELSRGSVLDGHPGKDMRGGYGSFGTL